jgi:hypothetical protein
MKIEMAQVFIEISNIKFQEHPQRRSLVVINFNMHILPKEKNNEHEMGKQQPWKSLTLYIYTCTHV